VRFLPTEIPDVLVVEPDVFGDQRGYFMETWHAGKFREAGLDLLFTQDNHSRSVHRVLRGLHYQIHQPQGKLVRVVSGEVFDVAVDLRRSSPTFKRWAGVTLSEANKRQVWIPPGFAHGFYVTGHEGADVVYKCTAFHAAEHERTLRWDDPLLSIAWPIEGALPILSAKDSAGLPFESAPLYP
jgi:dTDP-4-dehydrorhamnose 3,5-epimerase